MSVVTPAYKEWLEAKNLRHGWEPRKPGREHVWDGIARMTLTPLNPRDGRHD